MGLARNIYVIEGEEGVYHCISRCVRRSFLCGYDPLSGRDFSHRKKWILDRLKQLAGIFAIDVCGYAIMENHVHSILRTRPDILESWSDLDVAARWLELCPRKPRTSKKPLPPRVEQIQALADCPEHITVLRKRLGSLSWFVAKLSEFIARKANKEDKVKGRFWESRFKCLVLLDASAITACLVYVDLNMVRAGAASTPEDSDFTSIQERIRAWHRQSLSQQPAPQPSDSGPAFDCSPCQTDDTINAPSTPGTASSSSLRDSADCWLAPIQSTPSRRGILDTSTAEYFDLVDRSGRMIRSDKRGFIDSRLAPILNRIGVIPKEWIETVSHFGSAFQVAAGSLTHMREFAGRLNRHWIKGLSAARSAFT